MSTVPAPAGDFPAALSETKLGWEVCSEFMSSMQGDDAEHRPSVRAMRPTGNCASRIRLPADVHFGSHTTHPRRTRHAASYPDTHRLPSVRGMIPDRRSLSSPLLFIAAAEELAIEALDRNLSLMARKGRGDSVPILSLSFTNLTNLSQKRRASDAPGAVTRQTCIWPLHELILSTVFGTDSHRAQG